MELTTLQSRIEERAKQRLLKDLLHATLELQKIEGITGIKFTNELYVTEQYSPHSGTNYIKVNGEKSQAVFDRLLPRYVSMVTAEIMQKIDDIDYLLESKNEPQEQF